MEDKDVVELKDLKNYINDKWSIWYTPGEIMHEAPAGAPDWVKAAWVPFPKSEGHYGNYGKDTHTVDCSPNGVVLEGGPQAGTIKPHYPGKGGDSNSLVANKNGEIVGIYELKKQYWNYQGWHYHRMVYIFKPASPPVKLPTLKKKPVPLPPPHWYDAGLNGEDGEYSLSHYKTMEMEYEEEAKAYHKSLSTKLYKPSTSYSKDTHTGTMSFTINDMNPETMQILYGESAKLDPWAPVPEPEEDEEPALWDLV